MEAVSLEMTTISHLNTSGFIVRSTWIYPR